jgi:hypothetical protein
VTPITKRLAGCDGHHKSVESDAAAPRKPQNHGRLSKSGSAKAGFVIAIMAALPLMRHTVVDALVVGRTRATDVSAPDLADS